MMKKTLCLLFVLAFIAQIGAIPADKEVDAEKEVKEAADQAEDVKDKGAKDVADVKDKASEHADKIKKAADKAAHAATEDRNKGHHGEHPKHGGKDSHKPHADGPISGSLDRADEVGKKLTDAGVKAAKEFFRIFGL